ncbi:hypothetical protein [Pectinatus frisingensis]|jgi:L-threonine kinase|uniref:GHMP family kinase ATP-binding protein n=1 Tax=Pectinatus frisingensis TaxID=865 RepID=UPI0015F74D15|nr:hypothetical protein [Pectinatus frisingensis]
MELLRLSEKTENHVPVTVKVPGSCGELVQGVIDGEPFLITCPINMFSTAIIIDNGVKNVLKSKASKALKIFCTEFGLDAELLNVKLQTQLIKSKGMSSSSADIAAVCKAAAIAFGIDITAEKIAQIAARVEPTDGVFCDGIVKFNHITGEVLQYLGTPPPLKILVFDCGGSVDTIVFNQRGELPYLNEKKEEQVKQALELVEYGVKYKNAAAIGKGATISALANQDILCKEDLEVIIDIAEKCNAVGVNIAHSGTLIGVLFSITVSENKLLECVHAVHEMCPYMRYLFTAELIAGGFFTV